MSAKIFFAWTARLTFAGGLFFALMEVVYGYLFNVWASMYGELVAGQTVRETKAGETVLWAFLSVVLLLSSSAAAKISDAGSARAG